MKSQIAAGHITTVTLKMYEKGPSEIFVICANNIFCATTISNNFILDNLTKMNFAPRTENLRLVTMRQYTIVQEIDLHEVESKRGNRMLLSECDYFLFLYQNSIRGPPHS